MSYAIQILGAESFWRMVTPFGGNHLCVTDDYGNLVEVSALQTLYSMR